MSLPTWGCPWHGLVRAGVLTLPNGQTKAYPSPPPNERRTGDTFLVQVPGVPEVVRTPEEQAADTAAGRQWWNKAIISSGKFLLYGKSVDGWVYCDPDGARWRVDGLTFEPLSGNAGSWPVKLVRFGEFRGDEESYSHTVALGNLGQSTPTLTNVSQTTLQVRDIAPDGSRALLAIVAQRGIFSGGGLWPDGSAARWMPALGWLELTISGKGAEAVLSLSVLHTRAQTIGTYDADLGDWAPTAYYWLERTRKVISPGSPFIVEFTPTVHTTSTEEGQQTGWTALGIARPGNASMYEERTGVILAVWYSADGTYQRLTYDVRVTLDWEAAGVEWSYSGVDRTEDTVTVSRYTLSGSQSDRLTRSAKAVIRLNGVEVDSFNLGDVRVGNTHYDRDAGYSRTVNGASAPVNPPSFWAGVGPMDPRPELEDSRFVYLDHVAFYDGSSYHAVGPYELSNHVWALLVCDGVGTGFKWTWRRLIGPDAVTDGLTTTLNYVGGLRLYGSWCPATHQVVRSTTPVFWI